MGDEVSKLILSGDALYAESSYEDAVRTFMEAANMGSSAALFRLGYMVERGQGTIWNAKDAEDLYQKAADLGDPAGEFFLGRFYYVQLSGDARQKGVRLIERSASKSYPPALYTLGTLYYWGEAVEINRGLAHSYFEAAARSGHVFARMVIAKRKMAGRYGLTSCAIGFVEYLSTCFEAARCVWCKAMFDPRILK